MPELLSLAHRRAQFLLDQGAGTLTRYPWACQCLHIAELGAKSQQRAEPIGEAEIQLDRQASWSPTETQAGNRYQVGGKGLELQPWCQVGWVWGG